MRTGWASADLWLNRIERLHSGVMRPRDFTLWLVDQQNLTDEDGQPGFGRAFDVIVFETWKLRPDKAREMIGSEFPTPQGIGQLRLIAWLTGTRLVPQPPSDKPIADASRPDWYAALDADSSEQHDQDARKHLWMYYFRNWFDPTQEPA